MALVEGEPSLSCRIEVEDIGMTHSLAHAMLVFASKSQIYLCWVKNKLVRVGSTLIPRK